MRCARRAPAPARLRMRARFPAFSARRPAAVLLLALAASPAAAQTAGEVQIRVGTSGAADADGSIRLSTAEGSRTYPRFQIRLSGARTRSVPLTLRRTGSTNEGSLHRVRGVPSPAADAAAFIGPLTFAGESPDASPWVTFEVRPADDDIYDGSRSYTLTFAAPSSSANVDRRYRGARVSVTVANADDEEPPEMTLVLTPNRISESGSNNATRVTAKLNRRSQIPVRVAVSAAPVTPEAAAGDFTLSSNRTLTFREDRTTSSGTVTITAVDNDVDSPTRYVTVTGTATIGAAGAVPQQTYRLRLGIADDDEAGLVLTEAASPREITSEAGAQATFKVALKSEPTADVAVAVRSNDAGEGTASPSSLTFTADDWSTAQEVTVTGVDDDAVDGDQHYAITLDPSSGGGEIGEAGDDYYQLLASIAVPMTNRDDDEAGLVLTEAASPREITSEAGAQATFKVALKSEPAAAVAIAVRSSDAGEGTASPSSLTFTADDWSTAQEVTVTGVDDDAVDGDQHYAITLDPSSVGASPSATGDGDYHALDSVVVPMTNRDDEAPAPPAAPGLVVSATAVMTTEAPGAGRAATFTVRLASAPAGTVTVAVTGADATEGTVSPSSLTFTAGDWSAAQQVAVTGADDDAVDGDQTYTLTLDASSAAAGGAVLDADYNSDARVPSRTVSVTNIDDDFAADPPAPPAPPAAPGLVVSATAVTTTEAPGAGRAATFTVRLASAPAGTVTVAVTGADATEGEVMPASLTFTGGAAGNWNAVQTVMVTGVDDDADDGDQAYTLTLDASSAAAGGAVLDADYNSDARVPSRTVSVTNIDDDDAAPVPPEADGRARVTLALSPATIEESGANRRAAVTATLDRAAAADFWVTVSTDAAAGAAALSANRTLKFAAGDTASSGTVTITATDDNVDAPDRRVTVSGRAGGTARAADPADVALTIADDEPTPRASLALSPALILEAGGASSVTASLSGASSAATTVTVAAAAVGAVATTDFRLSAARTLVIPAGRTASSGAVTITAVDNELIAPDLRLAVSARAANAHAVLQPAAATLTIADDDGAVVVIPGGRGRARLALALSPAAIDESGADSRSVVTATLSRALAAAVAVTVSTDAPADVAALSANRTLRFAAGATASAGTVTIAAVDNDFADAARTVTVSGAAAGAGRPARAVLTIRDDDAASTAVRLSLDPPRVREDAGRTPILLQARLNGAPRRQATVVTVGVDPAGAGTAAVGEDYAEFEPAAVTIPAGETSGRGMLYLTPVHGPDTAEPAETIRLAGAADAAELAVAPVLTLTLIDLNHPPIANAGAPQRGMPGMRLMLDGSGSRDPEGEPLSYAWAQTSGPAVTLMDPNVARPEFLTPPSGLLSLSAAGGPGLGVRSQHRSAVLGFRLTVTDSRGAQSNADMTMVVVEERTATGGDPPVADAGDDQIVPEGAAVTLDGSGSRGAGTLAYAWMQLRGPPVALSGRMAVRPTFAAPAGMPAATVLEFGLVVTAGERSSARDTVRITVADAGDAPVADAGPDQAGLGEGAEVRLDGSGSVGAHALRYAWTQLPGGPRAVLSDAAAVRPRFTAPADLHRMTTLEFGLVVTDAVNGRSSARDTVRITVYGANDAPLANAGPDQDGLDEDAAVQLDGSGSRDPEGDAIAFQWRQRRGPPVALSSAASVRPIFRAPAALSARTMLEFELMVTDVHGRTSLPDMVRVTVRARAEARLERVVPTLLPEAARALADSRAEAVRQRLAAADRAGESGPASLPGLLEKYGPQARDGELEWKRALTDAAFTLPLDAGADGAGGITLWGRGDYRDLDGASRGLEWDGEAASAHLGADRLLANGWRAGLAVSWSEAKFDYTDGADGVGGDWDLEMTSVQPYLGLTTGGGLDLWATAALGSGDLDVADEELAETQTADADMWMAALGARGPLYAAGGMELALRGEALHANFEVDGDGGLIRRHEADVRRLRLALEASWERRLASGARLAPRLDLGARHDGGDGETGAGVELGGGVEYVSGRLTLSGGGRALVANSDYDEWGVNAAASYAPGADGRGVSFRMAPSWGETRSGMQELWERGAPGLRGAAAEAGASGRLEAELGYGLKSPFGRGLLKLTAGSALSEGDGGGFRLAATAAPDAAARIGLELEFRGSKSDESGYSLMVTGELRF